MAKKRSPVTVDGIRAKGTSGSASEPHSQATPRADSTAGDAYSFVADKFRKPTDNGLIWNAATQTCEFLWQVPQDVKKHGAVASGRKYVSNLLYFLARRVAEN